MPNPKLGAVTPDLAEAVKTTKGGQVEFRIEKTGMIHSGIGKASFSDADLRKNFDAFVDVIVKAKSSDTKGEYVRKAAISSTIGLNSTSPRWRRSKAGHSAQTERAGRRRAGPFSFQNRAGPEVGRKVRQTAHAHAVRPA